MIDIFEAEESLLDEDPIVFGPLCVPMIDLMKQLGVAIINSGDAMCMVFSDSRTMHKFGEDLQYLAECGGSRISLSPEGTPEDDIAVAKNIARELF